jgi:Tol biopolymer transport system component
MSSSIRACGRAAASLLVAVLAGCAGGASAAHSSAQAPAGHSTAASPPSQPAAGPDSLIRPGERHFGSVRQLTFEGNNAEAYFSSDGTRLIFQRQVDVESGCDQQYVINVDGTGLRRVSNGLGRTSCGYFYDDDRRIVFSSTHEHSPACPAPPDHSQGYVWPLGHFEIYSANADGSDLRPLTSNGAYNAEATLSPDGARLIYTSTADGDLDLYTMNVDGTDVRRITTRVGYDGGAFFSPDGRHIVWRAMYPETAQDTADYRRLLGQRLVRPSKLDIWVANADGSGARRVTDLGGANFAPYFHPDGERIVFASNHETPRGRNFDLYLIGMDGTGLERITFDEDFDGFPMFSPDGTRLVWASNRNAASPGETNIFIADWVE